MSSDFRLALINCFAKDDQKDEIGNVVPGIGGSIYEPLGIANLGESFIPQLIKIKDVGQNSGI